MKTGYTLLIALLLLACQNNPEISIDPENLLIGNWIDSSYDNEIVTFQRAASLNENAPGISFKENSVFIQRTSGWCGTPPLTFYDDQGTWKSQESLIIMSLENFPKNLQWRIISLDNNQLTVKRELSEQEKDHQDLMNLFNEITTLSNSISCIDSNNWSFTSYGTKACGGPQGFIAYSNEIDTVEFLKKIEAYNLAEKQYNIKWSIFSTCDVPKQPTSIECQNGYPIFKY
ncbi:hypothetical protein [Confluentibacter sediminis]|uniref:hypothetical protein n=1 Tax=Confluentibacter sediminis TaxID=2219045 RepID=UPI000DABB592|nr:hypothetical protein [Confluentibacter sediminis]